MLTAEDANMYTRTYELNNELESIESLIRQSMKEGRYNISVPRLLSTEAATILEDEGYDLTFEEKVVNISWE